MDSDGWKFGDGGFAKLYGDKIARSSLMDASLPARWLFVFLLSNTDKHGRFSCQSIENLSRLANMTVEQTAQALKELESPDPNSSSPEYEGRRVSRINGGWEVLNYVKYREFRTPRQIKDVERKRTQKASDEVGDRREASEGVGRRRDTSDFGVVGEREGDR